DLEEVICMEYPGKGVPPMPYSLPGSDGSMPTRLATSLECALFFVIYRAQTKGSWRLLAARAREKPTDKLDVVYSAPISSKNLLVQDSRAQRVFAVQFRIDDIAIAELGASRPELKELPDWRDRIEEENYIGELFDFTSCKIT